MAEPQNSAKPRSLTPNQQKAIAALMIHPTLRSAAESIGMGERTLQGYVADKFFQEAFREQLWESYQIRIANIIASSTEAIATLRDELHAGERSSDRIAAAKAILDYAFRGVDLLHTTPKIEALQADIEALKDGALDGNRGATESPS